MADYARSKKPKRVRYHFSIVFFAAVFIFGFMFYNYFMDTTLEDVLSQDAINGSDISVSENSGDAVGNDQDTQIDSTVQGELINPVPESARADDDYLNKCVFIGDSVTYGLASYNVVPATNVLASVSLNISNAETSKVDTQYGEMTVVEALTVSQPENVYVMLGTNGVAWLNANEMYQYFSSFMKSVLSACPESNVYIVSVPPVTAEKEAAVNIPVKNEDIDEFNSKLLDYCNRNELHYLDLNSYLKNENGVLPTDDAENDGMHFKYSTYTKFIDCVLTHVAE